MIDMDELDEADEQDIGTPELGRRNSNEKREPLLNLTT